MRTIAVVLPLSLLIVSLAGCAPLVVALPQGASETDRHLFEHPPSELSGEEPLLCTDGERGDADCTEPGALRWSVPLEGDHYVRLGSEGVVFDTRSQLSGRGSPRGLVAEGALHHFADDLLRVHDVGTGEHLWTADLREGAPKGVSDVLRTENRVFVGLGDGRWDFAGFDEIVVLAAGDGAETARLRLAEALEAPGGFRLVGLTTDEEVVVLRDAQGVYLGVDPASGEELWRAEPDTALEMSKLHGRTHRLAGGALDVITWTREDSDSVWEVVGAQRFDAATGADLGRPEVEGVEYSWEVGFLPREYYPSLPLEERSPGEERAALRTPSGDIDPGRWEALSGAGMGTLLSSDEKPTEVVGVACAPDALRDVPPRPVPWAVRCDNTRLFVVNL